MCNTQSFRPATNPDWKKYDKLKCPKCGYPQFCGCPSCKPNIPEGILPYKWSSIKIDKDNADLEVIICANCGYDNTPDWWMEEEEKQYKVQIPINKKKRKE